MNTKTVSTITSASNVKVGAYLLEQDAWCRVVGRDDLENSLVSLDLCSEGNGYRYHPDELVEVIDFTGWTVEPSDLDGTFTVRVATDDEWCDLCGDTSDLSNPTEGLADWTIDTGEANEDKWSYCFHHMVGLVTVFGPDNNDVWRKPGAEATVEAIESLLEPTGWQEATTQEHVILVAFEVEGTSREQAELALHERLVPLLRGKDQTSPVEAWWVAEDDRRDRSDCDSAVFVKPGKQAEAVALLRAAGLTA